MTQEQFDKIRDYLLAQGQQELLGHLDGFKQEYDKLKAQVEQPSSDNVVADTPLTEGQTPAPSGFPSHDSQPSPDESSDSADSSDKASPTAQEFQDSKK